MGRSIACCARCPGLSSEAAVEEPGDEAPTVVGDDDDDAPGEEDDGEPQPSATGESPAGSSAASCIVRIFSSTVPCRA